MFQTHRSRGRHIRNTHKGTLLTSSETFLNMIVNIRQSVVPIHLINSIHSQIRHIFLLHLPATDQKIGTRKKKQNYYYYYCINTPSLLFQTFIFIRNISFPIKSSRPFNLPLAMLRRVCVYSTLIAQNDVDIHILIIRRPSNVPYSLLFSTKSIYLSFFFRSCH